MTMRMTMEGDSDDDAVGAGHPASRMELGDRQRLDQRTAIDPERAELFLAAGAIEGHQIAEGACGEIREPLIEIQVSDLVQKLSAVTARLVLVALDLGL